MYDAPTAIDRVVIQEDQRQGQLIRAYVVEVQLVGNDSIWMQLSNGTSIGHKKIDLFAAPVTVTAVRLNVTKSVDTPRIRRFTAHLCDVITQQAVGQSIAAAAE
jgi:alpha-L-fucosidase